MTFKWKSGARHKADPQKTGELLSELENSGGLTAGRLVDVSRPQDALLHNEFEWDDPTAAELYREDQARHIIRCVVTVPDEQKPKETVRAFFRITTEAVEKPEYKSVFAIEQDVSLKEKLLKQAMREMLWFVKKYAGLKELLPVFAGINQVYEEHKNEVSMSSVRETGRIYNDLGWRGVHDVPEMSL